MTGYCKGEKIYLEIFAGLNVSIPLAYESVDLGSLSVCTHVCTNLRRASARTTERILSTFDIQEFIHSKSVLGKYLYLLRTCSGKRSPQDRPLKTNRDLLHYDLRFSLNFSNLRSVVG